mgnify:CR=1 FL=1
MHATNEFCRGLRHRTNWLCASTQLLMIADAYEISFPKSFERIFQPVARHSHHSSSIIINLRFRSSFSSFSNAKPTLVSLLNRVLENHHHNRQFTFVHFFKLPLKIQYILKVLKVSTVIWKSRKMSHFTILRAKRASFVFKIVSVPTTLA